MYKQIITITKGAETLPYSSLKKCCELNTDFSYDYIVRFKMPFEYKEWTFNRLSFNLPIGKKREGEIIKAGNDAETLINSSDKCNMHFVTITEGKFCPECGKRIKMKGDGTLEPLCEC